MRHAWHASVRSNFTCKFAGVGSETPEEFLENPRLACRSQRNESPELGFEPKRAGYGPPAFQAGTFSQT
ncbi:MAG: hypothetical protein ABEJ93_01555, partial [Candidatus Nanohalobium sp.]